MAKPKPRLIAYGGQPIPVGGTTMLDGNYPVTVTNIRAPRGNRDVGAVSVRHSWGDTDTVAPARLSAYISLD
ncbi:hypothetical protein AQI95_24695 [Streptomyces yokosukanensis]|uniref:Uncharacterized protein n=1 Tax=Streptomyces yokosukanensis TaxID=67386 RepID=A0A117Q104_9ACTN|nr:hypothetical protein [Streptomyces yokosukanensis]KUN03159.1 hypothetical protein AQI95_24695 [Streptomyces yokosukanensis]